MRALLHSGLALAIVLAPALCCCKVGLLHPAATAAPALGVAADVQPAPAPPVESCCAKARTACCHEQPSQPTEPAHQQPPQPGAPDSCACCDDRPDAAKTETAPIVSAPEPTGEVLHWVVFAATLPEQPGRFREGHPPDGTGVDARSAALDERHVLRC